MYFRRPAAANETFFINIFSKRGASLLRVRSRCPRIAPSWNRVIAHAECLCRMRRRGASDRGAGGGFDGGADRGGTRYAEYVIQLISDETEVE